MNTFISNNKFNKKKSGVNNGSNWNGKISSLLTLPPIFDEKYQLGQNASEIEPDFDFIAGDFCLQAIVYKEVFLKTQRVPIIVGGSNLYIQKLVEDHVLMFKYNFATCFILIDVEQSVLNRRVDMRADPMVNAGLMDEVRHIFITDVDYTKGI
ncbi:hypothetical protein H5410_020911 [Solanum commersonii]|uniref:Isopentenyltransferase n=1 Tax=Solanum commersonii TaxID=4109 RepID=A0A9J5ZFM3_SOLCO|nr:hypothetical protein H5410_020911 [Solanum commersonii]